MRFFYPILFSVLGLSLTIGQLLFMNRPTPPKERTFSDTVTSFRVEAPPPPPASKPKPKPKPQKVQAPPPPMPMMSSSLPGMSFGMDALQRDFSLDGSDLIEDQGNVVMTAKTVDIPPRPVDRKAPQYPRRARKKGVEGYVVLSMLVDEHGKVKDALVVESHPAQTFDDAALDVVWSWRFQPGEYKGKSVSVRVTQTLRFELG